MDASTVPELLAAHGYQCRSCRRVPTGKFNTTFVCTVAGPPGTVVLRVAPAPDAGFLFYEDGMMAQEPRLHRLIRERTSLPVPAILAHDTKHAVTNHDYLIMEYLEGTPLSEMHLPARLRDVAVEQTGRYLRELHDTCIADQYGYLGEHHCMEPQPDWTSAFTVMWRGPNSRAADFVNPIRPALLAE